MIGAKIRLPYPHAGQQSVLRGMRRFNWLAAGRRWRKTTLGLHLVTDGCIQGGNYIWGAPTYDQTRVGMEELKKAWGGVADFNLARMTADFANGRVFFRSMDSADNVRGYSADGVLIDEAGYIKGGVWHEVLRPMLIDTGGWLLAMGTPNGRNWLYQEWHNAADDNQAERWQIPTLGVRVTERGLIREPHPLENPDISFKEIERLYRTMPEKAFRQEILAEFIDDAGGVFRRVMDAATAEEQTKAQPGHQYIFGVDWAQQHDFTVIAVVDVTTKELVHLDRFNQIDYNVQRGRLIALVDRFKPSLVIAESNSIGLPNIQALQREGVPVQPFQTTNATKMAAIDALSLAFEQGAISILNEPVLIGELQAFEQAQTATGLRKFSAPDGMHDDTVIALALAWQGAVNAVPLVLW